MISTYVDYLSWGSAGWGDEFFYGFLMTLKISFASYALAIIFGLMGSCAKASKNKTLNALANSYTTIVRSLPEILMILIVYFAVAGMAERGLVALGIVDQGFEFNPFCAAVFALAFVCGAFMTEVLRAGQQAVPHGQLEAAHAIGMTDFQIFRRVVLPQMMRHAVPGMGNLWLAITKDSAIISVVGAFSEIMYTGYRAAAATKEYIFFYGLSAVLFLCITLVSLGVIHKIEQKLNKGYA